MAGVERLGPVQLLFGGRGAGCAPQILPTSDLRSPKSRAVPAQRGRANRNPDLWGRNWMSWCLDHLVYVLFGPLILQLAPRILPGRAG